MDFLFFFYVFCNRDGCSMSSINKAPDSALLQVVLSLKPKADLIFLQNFSSTFCVNHLTNIM